MDSISLLSRNRINKDGKNIRTCFLMKIQKFTSNFFHKYLFYIYIFIFSIKCIHILSYFLCFDILTKHKPKYIIKKKLNPNEAS